MVPPSIPKLAKSNPNKPIKSLKSVKSGKSVPKSPSLKKILPKTVVKAAEEVFLKVTGWSKPNQLSVPKPKVQESVDIMELKRPIRPTAIKLHPQNRSAISIQRSSEGSKFWVPDVEDLVHKQVDIGSKRTEQ